MIFKTVFFIFAWSLLSVRALIRFLCVFAFLLAPLYVFRLVMLYFAYFISYCLVVSISALDCLERLISEMTYYVLSETDSDLLAS